MAFGRACGDESLNGLSDFSLEKLRYSFDEFFLDFKAATLDYARWAPRHPKCWAVKFGHLPIRSTLASDDTGTLLGFGGL